RLFVMASDDQVNEGLAELGNVAGKQPQEVIDYILQKKVIPRDSKFSDQAIKIVLNSSKLFDRIQTPVVRGVLADEELANNLRGILADIGVPADQLEERLKTVLAVMKQSMKGVLSDATMPEKEIIVKKLVAGIMQDATIKNIIR